MPTLTFAAAYRKRWGIPPRGPGPHAAESYELPLPPSDHVLAPAVARAVLARAAGALTRCDREAVVGQVRRANEILYGTPTPTRAQISEAMRETYMDVPAPAGSAERTAELVIAAARASDLFGGPTYEWSDESAPDDALRPYELSIAWLFPVASEVVITNSRTAEMWRVSFSIEGDAVTFGTPTPTEISVTAKAQETMRRMRESGAARDPRFVRIVESGRIARSKIMREAEEAADGGAATAGVKVQLISAGPGNSGQKNYYTPEFIDQTIADDMFAGAQCYYDHPTMTEESELPERSVRKIAGYFSDPLKGTFETADLGEQPAALATFHAVTGNSEAASLMDTAREFAAKYPEREFIGFSIYSYGIVDGTVEYQGEAWNRVIAMSECISVDLVTRAGARGGPIFEESRMPKPTKTPAAAAKSQREASRENPWTDPNLQIDIRTKAEREADARAALAEQRGKILANPGVREAVLAAAGVKTREGDGTFTDDELSKIDTTLGLDPTGAISQTLTDKLGGGTDDGDVTGEESEDIDVESLDDASIDDMTPEQQTRTLKRLAKKAKTGDGNSEGKNVNESAAVRGLQNQVDRLTKQIEGMRRDDVLERLVEKHHVPEQHRGMFSRAVSGASTVADMAEAAADYARANLAPNVDGLMVGSFVESGASAQTPNFFRREI